MEIYADDEISWQVVLRCPSQAADQKLLSHSTQKRDDHVTESFNPAAVWGEPMRPHGIHMT